MSPAVSAGCREETDLAGRRPRPGGVVAHHTRVLAETGVVVHQPGVVGPGIDPAVGQPALEPVPSDPPARGQPDGVLMPDMHPAGGCTGYGETGDVG
jgi:hypothetical protein